MIPFISFFVPVTFLTLVGYAGNNTFNLQRDELLPVLNFQPFVYLLFVIVGISIVVSIHSRAYNWLASTEIFASLFIIPFAGAFSGWSFGLTIVALLHGQWIIGFSGLALTGLIAGFCLSPVILSRIAVALAQEVKSKLFPKRVKYISANIIALTLISTGAIGLLDSYM